jgi:hypothetical protein
MKKRNVTCQYYGQQESNEVLNLGIGQQEVMRNAEIRHFQQLPAVGRIKPGISMMAATAQDKKEIGQKHNGKGNKPRKNFTQSCFFIIREKYSV